MKTMIMAIVSAVALATFTVSGAEVLKTDNRDALSEGTGWVGGRRPADL